MRAVGDVAFGVPKQILRFYLFEVGFGGEGSVRDVGVCFVFFFEVLK